MDLRRQNLSICNSEIANCYSSTIGNSGKKYLSLISSDQYDRYGAKIFKLDFRDRFNIPKGSDTYLYANFFLRNPTSELGFKVLDGEIGSVDKWPGLKVLGNYPKIIP